MERANKAALDTEGGPELGGGLLGKNPQGLVRGEAGLARWQGLYWGSCCTGRWTWGMVDTEPFLFVAGAGCMH